MKVSWLENGEKSIIAGEMDIEDFLDDVQNGKWQDKVLKARNNPLLKNEVDSITPSGTFNETRTKQTLKQHSGLILMDIDHKDNPDLQLKRAALEDDPYAFAVFTSIGGFGLCLMIKINPSKHLESFLAIEQYLANQYDIIVDPSGKDVSRLRYVTYDPDLYRNKGAKKWTKVLPKKDRENLQQPKAVAFHDEDMALIISQIQDRGVNIAEDYDTWYKVGFAIAEKYGDSGREYFHIISRQSSKYDPARCDHQYNVSLKRAGQGGGVTFGSFIHTCKAAGLQTRTEQTQEVEIRYRQLVKGDNKLSRKEAVKSVAEYFANKGVPEERVVHTLKGIQDIPADQLQSGRAKVNEIEAFVDSLELRYNTITYETEREGVRIDDRDLNNFYKAAMHAISENISYEKLTKIIYSDQVPRYNPFLEYIERNRHLKPNGRYQELVSCITYEAPEEYPEFMQYFLKKWLLGIISAMHGTHSVLMLALAGPQGSGKTEFFRNILPEDLGHYYYEGKLGGGKDDDRIMATCLLCVDDEFGGMSKMEQRKFKEIASKSKFKVRLPYAKNFVDMPRYAVLGGTSNDYEILGDTTGNRRIIPINIIKVDIERMKAIDKDELFMELYHEWLEVQNGWMLTAQDVRILNEGSAMNEQPTMEEQLIEKFMEPANKGDFGAEMMTNTDVVKLLDSVATKSVIIRPKNVGLALKKLGYEKKKTRKEGGGVRLYYYVKTKLTDSFSEVNTGQNWMDDDFSR